MTRRIVYICFLLSLVLLFAGCAGQNQTVIEAVKQNSFSSLEKRTITLNSVVFDDWAYPELEWMKKIFPDNEEYWQFSYQADRYHGVKIVLDDIENIPREYDTSDDSYTYDEPDHYKVIAFFPRANGRLVRKFKRLYVSREPVRITGRYRFLLPGEVWSDIQIKEDDMPVFTIRSVR